MEYKNFAPNSDLDNIKSCNFKCFGNALENTLHIPLFNKRSALLISSNFSYGVGGIWFLQYVESNGKYEVSLIVGDERYIEITSNGCYIDVSSDASDVIYVAEF